MQNIVTTITNRGLGIGAVIDSGQSLCYGAVGVCTCHALAMHLSCTCHALAIDLTGAAFKPCTLGTELCKIFISYAS